MRQADRQRKVLWCNDFKNLLNVRHAREMTSLQNELESMKELLHTYEQSIERKDEVITNLTRGMQKQKDKFDMLKTFCEWKIKHNDVKREVNDQLSTGIEI